MARARLVEVCRLMVSIQRRGYVFAVLVLLLVPGALTADEVELEDGSRIVGTVRQLKGSRLQVRTRTMGVVRIRRDAIVAIRTDSPLTLELRTGERLTGTLRLEDGLLTIEGEEAAQVVTLADVKLIDKPQLTHWDRLDLAASGGLNVDRGNTRNTAYRLEAGGTYHHDNSRTEVKASTRVNEREEKEDARRSTFDLRHEYWGPGRFSLGGGVSLESNETSDLDLRAIVSIAGGYELVQGPTHRFEPLLGGAWISEDFVGGVAEESIEGLVGFDYRLRKGFVRFDLLTEAFPFNSDRTLINVDSKLRFELFQNLDLEFTYYHRYNSDPPVATETSDYGYTIGLGWSN